MNTNALKLLGMLGAVLVGVPTVMYTVAQMGPGGPSGGAPMSGSPMSGSPMSGSPMSGSPMSGSPMSGSMLGMPSTQQPPMSNAPVGQSFGAMPGQGMAQQPMGQQPTGPMFGPTPSGSMGQQPTTQPSTMMPSFGSTPSPTGTGMTQQPMGQGMIGMPAQGLQGALPPVTTGDQRGAQAAPGAPASQSPIGVIGGQFGPLTEQTLKEISEGVYNKAHEWLPGQGAEMTTTPKSPSTSIEFKPFQIYQPSSPQASVSKESPKLMPLFGMMPGATSGAFPGASQGVEGGFPGMGATEGQFPATPPSSMSMGMRMMQQNLSIDKFADMPKEQKQLFFQNVAQSGTVKFGAEGMEVSEGVTFVGPQISEEKAMKEFQKAKTQLKPLEGKFALFEKTLDAVEKQGINVDAFKEKLDAAKTSIAAIKDAENSDDVQEHMFALASIGSEMPELMQQATVLKELPKVEKKINTIVSSIDKALVKAEKSVQRFAKRLKLSDEEVEKILEPMRDAAARAKEIQEEAAMSIEDGDGEAALEILEELAEVKEEVANEQDKVNAVADAQKFVRTMTKEINKGPKLFRQIKGKALDATEAERLIGQLSVAKTTLNDAVKSGEADAILTATDSAVDLLDQLAEIREIVGGAPAKSALEKLDFGLKAPSPATDKAFTQALSTIQSLAPIPVAAQSGE